MSVVDDYLFTSSLECIKVGVVIQYTVNRNLTDSSRDSGMENREVPNKIRTHYRRSLSQRQSITL